jgi:hypothetical protein
MDRAIPFQGNACQFAQEPLPYPLAAPRFFYIQVAQVQVIRPRQLSNWNM